MNITMENSHTNPAASRVFNLQSLLGPAVLLKVPSGSKGPNTREWQSTSLADMTLEYLATLTENIGVLQGVPSKGLCSIDCDNDTALDEFLAKNPRLEQTLRTKGSRGANIWVRMRGEYPRIGKIKNMAGKEIGEWRGTGGQTIIHGKHPSGCDYTILNGVPPVELSFADIKWPDGWILATDKPRSEKHYKLVSLEIAEVRRKVALGMGVKFLGKFKGEDELCECLGMDAHTNPTEPEHTIAYLRSKVPTIYCTHFSCEEELEKFNHEFRQRCGVEERKLEDAKQKDNFSQITSDIRGTIIKIYEDKTLPEMPQKAGAIAVAVVRALRSLGAFYYPEDSKDFASALFFNSRTKKLENIESDSFLSWLSEWLHVNRASSTFKYIRAAVETASLSDTHSKSIKPERFFASRPGAIYISNSPASIIKITAQE
jgi:hypothetical protein